MTDDRDQVAVPEPEDDQVEESEVSEDEAEQVKGGPDDAFFLPNIGRGR